MTEEILPEKPEDNTATKEAQKPKEEDKEVQDS